MRANIFSNGKWTMEQIELYTKEYDLSPRHVTSLNNQRHFHVEIFRESFSLPCYLELNARKRQFWRYQSIDRQVNYTTCIQKKTKGLKSWM